MLANQRALNEKAVLMESDLSPSADLTATELLLRYRTGDARAASRLFQLYALRLSRRAEQHLSHRLKRRMDGEDVAQSVFRTFFRRIDAGQFQIDSSSQLWRLLVTIAVRKAQQAGRRMDREVDPGSNSSDSADDWLMTTLANEPGPDEAAALVDQIETLLDGLSPWHALVLEQRLAGITPTEIARTHGRNRDAVYSALKDLQERLSRLERQE